MKIEIKNAGSIVSDLKKFSKEIRGSIEDGLDIDLDKGVEDLKSTLMDYINFQITEKTPDPMDQTQKIDVPKSKIELMKEIFNVDIQNSDVMKPTSKGRTLDDKSKVMVMKQGRIKAWQNVNDASTYFGQEYYFKERLMDGIVYDADKGKMYKLPENSVKGIKLDCSTDTGQTLNSEKKFTAYKQSEKITRRKGDSPDQRIAVWTTRKEDLNFMMRNAIDLDTLIIDVSEGKYDTAITKLQTHDTKGIYRDPIEKIQNIKAGKVAQPGTKVYLQIQDLVKNLKIRKRVADYKTTYTLVTSYAKALDSSEQGMLDDSEDSFLHVLRQQIFIWEIENEQQWLDTITKKVEELIKRYNK